MITAVDTNILLDMLHTASAQGDASERLLDRAAADGTVIICEIVYAEMAAQFPDHRSLDRFLSTTRIDLAPSSTAALHSAGVAWRLYASRRPRSLECGNCASLTSPTCASCGAGISVRQHMVADFVVGAHALHHADRLLTHDTRYCGIYFPELRLGF